jgi:MSHA pilin protein MshC
VAVMIVIGILAAVAVPRLLGTSQFSPRAGHDFVASALRYAQKSAIAMRRNVCFSVAGSTMTATYASAASAAATCGAGNALLHPANGLAYSHATNALPGGATVSTPVSLVFDAAGRPLNAALVAASAPITVTVTGYAPSISIEPQTGLVR